MDRSRALRFFRTWSLPIKDVTKVVLIVLVAVLSCRAGVIRGECPHTNSCVSTPHRCILRGINDVECLRNTLNLLNSSDKTMVVLKNISLPNGLPGAFFRNAGVEVLVFQEFNMPTLNSSSTSPFAGATKLERLYFLNPASTIRNWKFEHLGVLQLTELKFSKIKERYFNLNGRLPEDFKYAGSDYIRTLEINTACLLSLMPRSLSTFHNLEKLILTGNKISTISRDVFPSNASKLRIIDLRLNNIQTLAAHEFWNPNLPSLREVYLERTMLNTFDSSFLTKQLEKFYINGNKLDCCPGLAWIAETNKSVWNGPYGFPAICRSPKELKERPVYSLTKQELENADCLK